MAAESSSYRYIDLQYGIVRIIEFVIIEADIPVYHRCDATMKMESKCNTGTGTALSYYIYKAPSSYSRRTPPCGMILVSIYPSINP